MFAFVYFIVVGVLNIWLQVTVESFWFFLWLVFPTVLISYVDTFPLFLSKFHSGRKCQP
eukprot:m.266781 g.266781  ORF g.266781 m.266781 type:complete len:59 (-) comp69342_c0_seq1:1-177(-)